LTGDAAVARAVAALTPPAGALARLVTSFREAIHDGLAGRPSSLKVLPTFVPQPTGQERGRVAVVDWGGTHGRVALIELGERGASRTMAQHAFRFSEADKGGPAARVFDVIAAALARLGDGAPRPVSPVVPVGFVYSFPARNLRVDAAVALSFTKGWRPGGLAGHDVGALLDAALGRSGAARGFRVAAVVNDTVAALALASYRARGLDPAAVPADVGLIVGTGTNQAADLGTAGIRNLESGNFDGLAGVTADWDDALDRQLADPAPGAQRFEKLAAGQYLGEILRRAVQEVGASSPLFGGGGGALDTPFALDAAHVSAIAADASPDLGAVDAVLRGLGVPSALAERRALGDLARAVVRRAARLIAAALLGTLGAIDRDLRDPHTVAVDGSVYGGAPDFPRLVRDGLAELAGRERAERVRLAYVEASTAAGAAVIAAGAPR
jgi:hexokinase